MIRKVKNFIYKIKRIIDFIPVLWNIYDFDYSSLYKVMKKQLERMEKFQREEAYHVDRKHTADKIHFAVQILNRLIQDEPVYLNNALMHHRRKWGEIILVDGDNIKEHSYLLKEYKDGVIEKEGKKLYPLMFTWEKVSNHKEYLEAEKESRRAGKHADWIRRRDRKLLFNHIHKHIERWWD